MKTFSKLLDNSTSRPPEDVQVEAKDSFSDYLARSHLHERLPNSPVPDGVLIVLAVATYSLRDMKLLDEINDCYTVWSPLGIQIEVFDVMRCRSQNDFARFVPGLARDVYETPVVAIWMNQTLDGITTGEHSVRTLLKSYHLL